MPDRRTDSSQVNISDWCSGATQIIMLPSYSIVATFLMEVTISDQHVVINQHAKRKNCIV